MQGSKIKTKTGSHIDSNSFNLAGGLSTKKEYDTHTLLMVAYLESGWGGYDTYSSFSSGKVHGDGDTKHYGLGLMLKRENNNGLYLEGSLRGGRVETDFKTRDMGAGADFDSKSTYWGAHLGVGEALQLKQNDVLDTYLKLFYTRQGSDSVTTGAGEKIHFDSADSTRIRLGARYIKEFKQKTKYYAGLAWEYEFSGKQKATIDGRRIKAPDMKGSSAFIELGLKHDMSDKWSVDLSAQGMLGKREGIAGNLSFNYKF